MQVAQPIDRMRFRSLAMASGTTLDSVRAQRGDGVHRSRAVHASAAQARRGARSGALPLRQRGRDGFVLARVRVAGRASGGASGSGLSFSLRSTKLDLLWRMPGMRYRRSRSSRS